MWVIGPPDLEAIPGHSDDQGEGGTSRQRRVIAPLFWAPAPMLEAVKNHMSWETVIARVEMQCHVCVLHGTTLQVHKEPKKRRKYKRWTFQSVESVPFSHKLFQTWPKFDLLSVQSGLDIYFCAIAQLYYALYSWLFFVSMTKTYWIKKNNNWKLLLFMPQRFDKLQFRNEYLKSWKKK